jgi:hypothetical protein
MSIASEIVTAHKILNDWLGEGGKPVSQELAESRAKVCVNCPYNTKVKLWEKLKSAAADVVRSHIEIKTGMDIHADGEDELGMCRICSCVLFLKVHVPLKHITDNTDDETLKRFQTLKPDCWIYTEAKP